MLQDKPKAYRWLYVLLIFILAFAVGAWLFYRANLQLNARRATLAEQQVQLRTEQTADNAVYAQLEALQRQLLEAERQNDGLEDEINAAERKLDEYEEKYGPLQTDEP